MNNPLQLLVGQLINNTQYMQNPIFSNAVNMMKNGDNKGLENLANNLCASKGTSILEMRKQLGI